MESRSWRIPSKQHWLREYLTGSWYPPMMKRSRKSQENMEQKFLSCAVRRRQMIMPLRRMCWKKCWQNMKNAGNILIPCAVSIPPLLLLHLTGCRRQCACWQKARGTPCFRSYVSAFHPSAAWYRMRKGILSSNGRSIVTAVPRIWSPIIMMRDSSTVCGCRLSWHSRI